MIVDFREDHETIISQLREDVQMTAGKHQDAVAGDFLTGILDQHGKMGRMSRANREGSSI